mgnify:CR=1 FL=1
MKIVVMMFATLAMLASNAFAQKKGAKDKGGAVVEDVRKDVVVEVLGEGEDQVIEIPYVVQRIHEVDPEPRLVVVEDKSDTSLRGGVGFSYAYLLGNKLGNQSGGMAMTADLVGEIGFKSSPWRVRARVGVGEGSYDTIAAVGSLAIMCYAVPGTKTMAVGVGLDLLGTINKDSHPRETWNERFYGPSVRVSAEKAGMLVDISVSYGVRGTRAPGDTPEEYAMVGGASISYLWGK